MVDGWHEHVNLEAFVKFRFGLCAKAVVVVTVGVMLVTLCAQWRYYSTARDHLRGNDMSRAMDQCRMLSITAEKPMISGTLVDLQSLVEEFVLREGVAYAAIFDPSGRVLAASSVCKWSNEWSALARVKAGDELWQHACDRWVLAAYPVRTKNLGGSRNHLLGDVRMVLDTSRTRAVLSEVGYQMAWVTILVMVLAIPAGMVAIWFALLRPMQSIVATTRRLADGDLTARCSVSGNDEIGELAVVIDSMASEVHSARKELEETNELLENKVAMRTKELNIANRRLRSETTEKEDFLRAASHDLNAPLRNIHGMANMALRKWREELPQDVVMRLKRIQANVENETQMIDDILELSRIRSCPEERSNVDMGELMQEVCDCLEYDISQKGIKFTLDGGMPMLHVEPNRMRQVFRNLVDNAIKYMHRQKGGWIKIGYEFCDDMHVFSVSDNGPGIEPGRLKSVFHVFNRGNVIAEETQGKGVGLAMVKNVADTYEGVAYVESDAGMGSRFVVELAAECTQASRI